MAAIDEIHVTQGGTLDPEGNALNPVGADEKT